LLTETKPLGQVSALDIRGSKVCVVFGEDQQVACFGGVELDTANKRPARNSFIPEALKRNKMALRAVSGLAVGLNQVCVVGASQEVTCIPPEEESGHVVPVKVTDASKKPLKDIWQLKAQGVRACALSQADGAVWCWGQERYEQAQNAKPVLVQGAPAREVIQISLSNDRLCAIRGTERELLCSNPLSGSDDAVELRPLKADSGEGLKRVLMLSSGVGHFCAVTELGKLYCFGKNDSYQFGQKQPAESLDPVLITLKSDRIRKVTRVTTGDHHTCVTSVDDPTLYCFGQSLTGGANSPDPVDYPL
jgi:hypothetical protein